jgi:homoserine kinase
VREAFDAARGAGAAAVAISGAGPGAIAFTDNEQTAQKSVTAMEAAFCAAGLTCWGCVTRVSEEGAKWVVA